MNKKTIIQLVIIVVAFGAAGLVLYNGFYGNNNAPVQPAGGIPSLPTAQEILPYGKTLDFSKALDPNRFQYNQINYSQLDPQNEVGISQDSLIVPPPVAQPAK
jgi:hypothetical protein